MSTENIVINIREDGSREVVRNINNIGHASGRAQGSVDMLYGALRALGGALALGQLARWADTWTAATGKVNIFTHSVEETQMMMARLVETAQDARQPLDATVNSFHQMTLAASSLGASQEQLLDATSAVNKVFAIQGTSSNTARGGIIQFGQAMTEGIVRAQEYNSMINAMPLLLKVVAQNLEGAGGSVAKLRQMMLAGELTSKKFFEALLAGQGTIDALFERSGKTIGQAFTVLDNAMTQFVGSLDKQYGISQSFFELAQWGAKNIQDLAAALAIVAAPAIIRGLLGVASALQAMAAAAWANPYIALAAGITMAATALALYRNEIILNQKEQLTLGDYTLAVWDVITEKVSLAADVISTELPKAFGNITGIQVSFDGIGDIIQTALNKWIGWFAALPKIVIEFWSTFPGALYNIFVTAFNNVKGLVANNLNQIINMINPILEKANISQMVAVQFEETKPKAVKSWTELMADIDKITSDSMNTDRIGAIFDNLTDRAKKYSTERKTAQEEELKRQKQIAELMNVGSEGDNFAATKKVKGEFDNPRSLENNLRRLLNTIQPLSGAVLEYSRAERILDAALKQGRITAEQRAQYLELVTLHYKDIINPIGAVINELRRENQIMAQNSDQRQISTQMYQIQQDLQQKGIILTDAQTAAIMRELQANQELSKQQAANDQLYDSTIGRLEDLRYQVDAVSKMYESGGLSLDAYRSRMNGLAIEAANLRLQMGQALDGDALTSSLGQVLDGYTTAIAGITDAFGNMFTSMTDGFANAIAGAIMGTESLGDAIRNVAQQAVQQLIASLIKVGIQYMINAAIGESLGAAAVAAQAPLAAATAAAWAPAAAMVSLATLGTNATAAAAAITSTNALAMGMAVAGFKNGGYTGDGPTNAIAGVVHGGEYVMRADTVARYGIGMMDAIQNGTPIAPTAGGGSIMAPAANDSGPKVNVTVINNADGTTTKTNQEQNGDTTDITVQIDSLENALAGRMNSGRGPLHKATKDAFGLKPATVSR